VQSLTLQIIVNAPTHAVNDSKGAAYRYRNGDIIAGHRTADNATFDGTKWFWNWPITSPRTVFVHITGVPDALIDNALLRLSEQHKTANIKLRKRRFRIPPSVVPNTWLQQLLIDRETTVSWTVAKQRVRKKLVTNADDASTDNETTQLTDGDLV